MSEETKKQFKIFFGLLLILIIIFFIYSFLYKGKSKNNTQISNVTIVNSTNIDFNSSFPKGLIPENDILNVLESYKAVSGTKTQYTYKYNSIKDLSGSVYYFDKYISSNKWKQSDFIYDTNKGFYSISATKNDLFVNIVINQNKTGKGSVVDITMIK